MYNLLIEQITTSNKCKLLPAKSRTTLEKGGEYQNKTNPNRKMLRCLKPKEKWLDCDITKKSDNSKCEKRKEHTQLSEDSYKKFEQIKEIADGLEIPWLTIPRLALADVDVYLKLTIKYNFGNNTFTERLFLLSGHIAEQQNDNCVNTVDADFST